MKRFCVLMMSSIALLSTLGRCQKSEKTVAHNYSDNQRLHPSAEIERLLKAFKGDWSVSENFEVSASQQGRTRQGRATFTIGPGFSLVENYRSGGSAGDLRFLESCGGTRNRTLTRSSLVPTTRDARSAVALAGKAITS